MRIVMCFTLLLILNWYDSFAQSNSSEKATIIFYRNSLFGAVYKYDLKQDEVVVTLIKNRSFFAMDVDPGTYKFTAKIRKEEPLRLEVKEGQSYVVRCSIRNPPLRPGFHILSTKEITKKSTKGFLSKQLKKHGRKL